MPTIHGTFDVTLTPIESELVARMSIKKTFNGPLNGASKGEMLSFRSDVEGSAGYVAIEHVNATLEGREGTFVLMHRGEMNRGAASLSVSVVPDSGTAMLEGLLGEMNIENVDGEHRYTFDYSL